MIVPDGHVTPPPLTEADLPEPGAFPDALADRLLDEVQQCAAYTPLEQAGLLAWALWNLAATLLGREDPPVDISELDPRIRRALFITVERMVELFPDYRRHIGAMLRAFISLMDEKVILVGVKPCLPLGVDLEHVPKRASWLTEFRSVTGSKSVGRNVTRGEGLISSWRISPT